MPSLEPLLIGAASGAVSTSVLQPLDVIKTRIQINKNVSGTNSGLKNYPGLKFVIQDVIRCDGIAGLWKGLCPSLLRTVPGAGIYFFSLHSLTQTFSHNKTSSVQSLFIGMCARTFAGMVTMPFSVLKTRYESGVFSYGSVTKALFKVYKLEGFKGMFRGMLATLTRDVPYSGLYFMVYSYSKRFLVEELNVQPSTVYFFSCAVFAGFMSSLLTHPPDVIKTHLQTYPETCHSYSKAWQVIVKNYGNMGFFRGLAPRLAKKTLMSTISWTTFEKVMQILQKM